MADDYKPVHHKHDANAPDDYHVRGNFATKLGFILAAAGSAVGLGNIWRFPWLVGENGGSAFILVYLICIVIVGMPVMLAEFIIGRHTQTDQVSAYSEIRPGTPWCLNGLLGLVSGLLIMSFYAPVAGWVLAFGCKMGLGMFGEARGMDTEAMTVFFQDASGSIIGGTTEPIVWMLVIMVITGGIIAMGVEGGIERACKVLMPTLLGIMVLLLIRSLTLPGMSGGLAFLLKPDFSKISGMTILEAMSQAFFTLSLAMGAMMTYASYVRKEVNLSKMVVSVASIDTGIALLAGLIIFPAVFAFGMEPAAGPALIFHTLPVVFTQMPLGHVIGTAFFLLLTVAAITSTISLVEPIVTWFVDGLGIRRIYGTLAVVTLIVALAIPVTLSVSGDSGLFVLLVQGEDGVSRMPLFDVFDFLATKLAMPIGAIVICLFTAFGMKRAMVLKEAVGTEGTPGRAIYLWYWVCITLSPVLILLVLLQGLGVLG